MVAPRGYVAWIDDANHHRETSGGASVGLRFADRERTFALHPDLLIAVGDQHTYYTFGFALSVSD